MRLTAAGSCAAARRPKIVRPIDTGRSKSPSHQTSIGLRWMARRVESDPRGLLGRAGYGGTKSLEDVDAADMRSPRNDLGPRLKPRRERPTGAKAKYAARAPIAGQNAVR